MNEHDPVLAKHLKAMRKMSDAFQNVANIYHRNGVPTDLIASVYLGSSLDSAVIVFGREKVIQLLEDALATITDLDEDAENADILHCEGSA